MSKLPKRSLYTLIFLAIILLGGVVALARTGNFNIFASSGVPIQGSFAINVKDLSGSVVPGVDVNTSGQGNDFGSTDSSGNHTTVMLPISGYYLIKADYSVPSSQLCSTSQSALLNTTNQQINITLPCYSDGHLPSSSAVPSTGSSPGSGNIGHSNISPVAAYSPTTLTGAFTLDGKVTDASGQNPMKDVTVDARDVTANQGNGGTDYSITTKDDGSYSLTISGDTNQANAYVIRFTKANYKTAYHTNQTTIDHLGAPATVVAGGDYHLSPVWMEADSSVVSLIGRTYDKQGKSLGGVNVTVTSCQRTGGGGPWSGTSLSGVVPADSAITLNEIYANYIVPNISRPTDPPAAGDNCVTIVASKPGYTVVSYDNSPAQANGYKYFIDSTTPNWLAVDIALTDDNASATLSPSPLRSAGPSPSITPTQSYFVEAELTHDGGNYLSDAVLLYQRSGEQDSRGQSVLDAGVALSQATPFVPTVYNAMLPIDPKTSQSIKLTINPPGFSSFSPNSLVKVISLSDFQKVGNKHIYYLKQDFTLANHGMTVKVVNQSGSPIKDAQVKLYDNPAHFTLPTQNTDASGKVIITSQAVFAYLFNNDGPHNPVLEVNKSTFHPNIQFVSLNGQTLTVVLTQDTNTSALGHVKVNVVDPAGNKLTDAKVFLRYDSKTNSGLTNKTTNAQGYAQFVQHTDYGFWILTTHRNIIFNAYKDGYFDGFDNMTGSGSHLSNFTLDVSKGKDYELTLTLYPKKASTMGPQDISVLWQGTSEPVKDAKVEIKDALPALAFTSANGSAQFMIYENKTYHVKVTKDSQVKEKDINIPPGYFSADNLDQPQFDAADREFVIYMDQNKLSVNSVPIIVQDQNGHPLSGVQVAIPPGLTISGYSSNQFIGTTGADGRIVYTGGFNFFGAVSDFLDHKASAPDRPTIKFTDGENLQIFLNKSGYYPPSPNATVSFDLNAIPVVAKPIVLKMTSWPHAGVYVYVEMLASKYDKKVSLQKKLSNGTWQDVSATPTLEPNNSYYFAVPSGTYRAKEQPDIYSNPGAFNGTQDLILDISAANELCTHQGVFVKHYPNFTMIFENEALYRAHQSLYDVGFVQQINHLRALNQTLDPLVIGVGDINTFNAFASPAKINCPNAGNPAWAITFDPSLIENLESQGREDDILAVLTHEYGHDIEFRLEQNGFPLSQWNGIFEGIGTLPSTERNAIWSIFIDSNSNFVPWSGHPYEDPEEMFASFFQAYFVNHDDFYGRIRYHTTSEESNILGFMWQLFSQRVGRVYPDDSEMFTSRLLTNWNPTFDQVRNGSWIR